MLRKPNPLMALWRGFKVFTIGAAWMIGIGAFVLGMVSLDSPVGTMLLITGMFSCWAGRSISESLVIEAEEDLKRRHYHDDDDNNANPPLAPA